MKRLVTRLPLLLAWGLMFGSAAATALGIAALAAPLIGLLV